MAYQTTITCRECGKNKQVIVPSSGGYVSECGECKAKIEQEMRDRHFAELDALSLEERIRRIEEWIYDYKPTHVPPPRF